jgi:hypothetical protein
MYGVGETPSILQGAANRETLSPDQLSRLQSQNIPTENAAVNVSSVLPTLIIGGVAAWFLAGGSRRRSLWILALFVPSMLAAQIPTGLTSFTNLDEWCQNPPFKSTNVGASPEKALVILQRADKCGMRITMTYARRIYTTTGKSRGPYSAAKHREASDAFARALPPDTLRKYVGKRVLLGIITGDDYGCAECWGGTPVPWIEARNAANFAKQRMPEAPVGIRLDAVKIKQNMTAPFLFDFAVAQWIASKGNMRIYGGARQFYVANAAAASANGLRVFYGVNTTHCTGAMSTPQCTPAQIRDFGTAAANQPNNCGLIPWWWEAEEWRGPYKREWERVFALASSKTFTSCKVR